METGTIIGHLAFVQHDADDINYDGTTSGLLATELQAAVDELATGIPGLTVTNTFYVDNKRAATYTETGSIATPFRTIQAAIDQVIANGDNSATVPYVIEVAPGMYSPNVVLEDSALKHLSFNGSGVNCTKITGSIQSKANNTNLSSLVFRSFDISGVIDILGTGTNFGNACEFVSCNITSATITAESITCFNLSDTKWDSAIAVTNVYTSGASGSAGGNPGKAIAITYDTAKPNAGRCSFIADSVIVGTVTSTTNGGAGTAIFQARLGVRAGTSGSAHSASANSTWTLQAGSAILGTLTNSGALTINGGFVSTLAGAGTVTLSAKCSQISNTPAGTIASTNVQDAINELDDTIHHIPINTPTASYPLVIGDDGKFISMNVAGACTLTVPKNATVAFAVGTKVLVQQLGTGQVTITPEDGAVTLNAAVGLKTSAQYGVVTLIQTAANVWSVFGDLAA